jgi:hypothetical protein
MASTTTAAMASISSVVSLIALFAEKSGVTSHCLKEFNLPRETLQRATSRFGTGNRIATQFTSGISTRMIGSRVCD